MTQNPLREETGFAAELAAVAEHLCRSTVQVLSGNGGGSGVIWAANGLIITNSHVVQSRATVQLADGRVFEAVCKSRDPQRDLAALEVAATDLPAAMIADSNDLRVGQLVLAVGNPLGLVGALSTGIISRLDPAASSQGWVMANVRLFPGNSGGPLADAQGRVVGINSMVVGGLALAVPSQAVERFLRLTCDVQPTHGGETGMEAA